MDENGYGCFGVLVFFAVWIGCTLAFGPLGFMLGWMPAIILALTWPIIAALGALMLAVVVALVILAIGVLYWASQSPAPM